MEEDVFAPVVSGRMSSQIVGQVQAAIREGKLRSGDGLPPERELARMFGVSRVTVRDALRALEALGLVEIRVGSSGGAYITAPSAELVGQGFTNLLTMSSVPGQQVAEARLAVEIAVVAMVVARCTPEQLKELEALCEAEQEALERRAYNPELANKFHVTLAKFSGNEAVRLLIESFRGPLSMTAIRGRARATQSGHHAVKSHRDLVDAIREGDAAFAQEVMARHLLGGVVSDEEAVEAANMMRAV